MASLTETAYFARKAVNVSVIILILVVILRILWNVASGIRDKYFPPPPPPATVAFDKLPYPNGQNTLASPSGGLTYTLETVDGGLPTLPPTLPIFFMTKAGPSFNSFDKMKVLAGKIGFIGIPAKTGATSWHFVDTDNPLRTLDIDEISQNFRETFNFAADPSLFAEKNFTSVDDVIATAKGFFNGLGLLASDLTAGNATVALFRYDTGVLHPVTAISDADAVGITLNRAEVSANKTIKYPVVSPDVRQGLVSVLFSGASDPKKKILDARYFYAVIDQENWATYPLIKSSAALDFLKAGKAIYASFPDPMPTSVTIRQAYVAYLDPYPAQSYLQPVLVFTDQKGFVAYVPLVDPSWLR
ncbi:hypothetical protein HY440_00105 [Candidatus Microgenomates bacterium]|nr:hypothetical protein [Candidatus Microgenomates bacterium]